MQTRKGSPGHRHEAVREALGKDGWVLKAPAPSRTKYRRSDSKVMSGFAVEVTRALRRDPRWDEDVYDVQQMILDRFKHKPDAYKLDIRRREVFVAEVEDQHAMDDETMVGYYNLGDWLDGIGWTFHLVVVDARDGVPREFAWATAGLLASQRLGGLMLRRLHLRQHRFAKGFSKQPTRVATPTAAGGLRQEGVAQ